MNSYDEWSKIDGELLVTYQQRFGNNVCTFTRPDLSAEEFNTLFRTALETGVEVDYEAAGWEPQPPADVLI